MGSHKMGSHKAQTVRCGFATLVALLMTLAWPGAVAEAFEPEPIGEIASLPAQYPDHWVMVHDFSFFHMFEGKVLVIDPLAQDVGGQYKGMMTASFIAAFQRNKTLNEMYVVETFYSRGARGGERADFVTIYDPATLAVTAEISIPPKRVSGMPKTSAYTLLADDRLLAIYNFTPGQSVSIVDLTGRKFVGEIPTSGCGFTIATGARSFTSICANGSFLTSHLTADGALAGTDKTEPVFDAQQDPIFETPAIVDGVAYFPKFSGQVLPVDVSDEVVKIGETWWLTGEDERGWRPGGMNLITVDSAGLAYVLMHPDGDEGTHKNGGSEVWVFDLPARQRLARITLENWGLSLGTSGTGEGRLLLVTNADMGIDVYRLSDASFVHTLQTGAVTPFLVHGAH